MATNYIREGEQISLAVPSTIVSGGAIVVGDLHGVALTSYSSVTGEATIALEGVFDLSVTATSGGGSTAIEIGDPVYINVSTFALTNNAANKFFGHALEAVAAGATSTINVRVLQSPSAEGGTGEVITYETFRTFPVSASKLGTACTGSAGDENVSYFGMNGFEWHVLGTQTLLNIPLVATGWDVGGLDQTADDGVEITRGILANSPEKFVIGTSPAFYARCKFSIADVSGTDDCAFGFRKLEAYQANIDDYADMAALNVISGAINIETIKGGAATTTTDTTNTWADGATHTLEVKVSSAGVVTYLIDGAAPTTTAAYTFTDALSVIPFFYFLQHTDIAGSVPLMTWEVGYQ